MCVCVEGGGLGEVTCHVPGKGNEPNALFLGVGHWVHRILGQEEQMCQVEMVTCAFGECGRVLAVGCAWFQVGEEGAPVKR